MAGKYGRKLVRGLKHVICTTGRKKNFKVQLEVGRICGMKIGGENKENLVERRERISSRKRIKK